eukprot:15339312-Ditylum_brightwellii.AAC.1
MEGALMSAYAWNLAPVIGTDICRSLVVVGREYNFSIDFTTRDEFSFNVTPQKVASCTEDMLDLLEKCQFVYKMLISEQRILRRN